MENQKNTKRWFSWSFNLVSHYFLSTKTRWLHIQFLECNETWRLSWIKNKYVRRVLENTFLLERRRTAGKKENLYPQLNQASHVIRSKKQQLTAAYWAVCVSLAGHKINPASVSVSVKNTALQLEDMTAKNKKDKRLVIKMRCKKLAKNASYLISLQLTRLMSATLKIRCHV